MNHDVDVGILGSKDVSFVTDAAEANSHYDACFYKCLESSSGDIYGYFHCAYKCFYSQNGKDETMRDASFIAESVGDNHHTDNACIDFCIQNTSNIWEYFVCSNGCSVDRKDENIRDTSFISESVGVNNHDDDACIDGCLRSSNDIYEYVFCSFLCFRFRDSKDEDKSSLKLDKVYMKKKILNMPTQCVQGCHRGNGHDLDCVAMCYGSPSYCHYSCSDETNNDESYRQCLTANNCDGLKSFAKKASKYD